MFANMKGVTFTTEEAKALFDLIDGFSGGNPENAFANDGTDALDDVTTRAIAKLYAAAGRADLIPDSILPPLS